MSEQVQQAASSEFVWAKETNVRKSVIDSYASEIAKRSGYKFDGNIKGIVRQLGGTIYYLPAHAFSEAADASIAVYEKGKFEIRLPDYTPETRDTFSIAHELGHYFLHYPMQNKPMLAYRNGSERVEWEANWFAAGFLMPLDLFRTDLDLGYSESSLASKYGVSLEAARIRARQASSN